MTSKPVVDEERTHPFDLGRERAASDSGYALLE
jgi:hypothetical protein